MRRPGTRLSAASAVGCAVLLTAGCTTWVPGTARPGSASSAQPAFVVERTITLPDDGGYALAAHPDVDGRPPVVLWSATGSPTWAGGDLWAVRAGRDDYTEDQLRADATLVPGLLPWVEWQTGHGMSADGVLSVVAAREDGSSAVASVTPGPDGTQGARQELQLDGFGDDVFGSVSGAFAQETDRRYLWRAADFVPTGEVLAYDGDQLHARREVDLGAEEWGSEDRLVTSPNGRWVALVHGGYDQDDTVVTVWDADLRPVRTVTVGLDPQIALDDRGTLYDLDDLVPGVEVAGLGAGLFRWTLGGPDAPDVVPLPDVQVYTERSAEPSLALVPGESVRYALISVYSLGGAPGLALVDLEQAAIVDRIELCPSGTDADEAGYGPPVLSADGSSMTVLGWCGGATQLWVLRAVPPS